MAASRVGHGGVKGWLPRSRLYYWQPKLEQNTNRCRTKVEQIESLGWQSLIIWQCEMKDLDVLRNQPRIFLEGPENPIDI